MNCEPFDFRNVASRAALSPRDVDHFVEGMTGCAEALPLDFETLSLLLTHMLLAVLRNLNREQAPIGHGEQPFAFVTPSPLNPLYLKRHLLTPVVNEIFLRGMGISVMYDQFFKELVEPRMVAAKRIPFLIDQTSASGAQPFSTSVDERWMRPRSTVHFSGAEGNLVSVGFLFGDKFPESPRRVVFGEEAAGFHDDIHHLHRQNIDAGRGTDYVRSTCGQYFKGLPRKSSSASRGFLINYAR